jgi:hypothetical protein
MTAEEYRNALSEIHHDMSRASAAISGLYGSFNSIIDFSHESARALIRLISDDIDRQSDHIERLLEGKCTIRDADPAALRPPELWEQTHTQKATNAIKEAIP